MAPHVTISMHAEPRDHPLYFGLMAGGLFGLAQLIPVAGRVRLLPLGSQLGYVAWSWYAYAALGALAAWLVAVAQRRLGVPASIWPGAAALTALLGLEGAALAAPAARSCPRCSLSRSSSSCRPA